MNRQAFVLIVFISLLFLWSNRDIFVQPKDWRSSSSVVIATAGLVSPSSVVPNPSGDCTDCDGTGWNSTDGTMKIRCVTCGGDGVLDSPETEEDSKEQGQVIKQEESKTFRFRRFRR